MEVRKRENSGWFGMVQLRFWAVFGVEGGGYAKNENGQNILHKKFIIDQV